MKWLALAVRRRYHDFLVSRTAMEGAPSPSRVALPMGCNHVNVHIMRTVNVAELRSHLSAYLARVRGGEEILIRDRTLVVAKIVPLSKTENYGEELLELAALGHLRLPETSLDLKSFFALPTANIAVERMRAAFEVEREREEG